MSDKQLENQIMAIKSQSAEGGKDPKTRLLLIVLLILWLGTSATLVGVGFKSYFDEKQDKLTLAQELSVACESGSFGPGFTSEDEERLCKNAEKVIANESIPGSAGPQGPQGAQGPAGLNGSEGPRGFTGPTGPRGPRGFDGATGLPGLDGQNGSDGADGEAGSDGVNGLDGQDGANGADGISGANGQDGTDGEDGATGPQGPEGPEGPRGQTGPPGPTGTSGVANVTTVGCEGPIVSTLSASYDAATQTIVITCNGG